MPFVPYIFSLIVAFTFGGWCGVISTQMETHTSRRGSPIFPTSGKFSNQEGGPKK